MPKKCARWPAKIGNRAPRPPGAIAARASLCSFYKFSGSRGATTHTTTPGALSCSSALWGHDLAELQETARAVQHPQVPCPTPLAEGAAHRSASSQFSDRSHSSPDLKNFKQQVDADVRVRELRTRQPRPCCHRCTSSRPLSWRHGVCLRSAHGPRGAVRSRHRDACTAGCAPAAALHRSCQPRSWRSLRLLPTPIRASQPACRTVLARQAGEPFALLLMHLAN